MSDLTRQRIKPKTCRAISHVFIHYDTRPVTGAISTYDAEHSGSGPHHSVPPSQSDKQRQSCEHVTGGELLVVDAIKRVVGAGDDVVDDDEYTKKNVH